MPLPNYGHYNKEKKTHQDLVFEMAPEIVSDEETELVNGRKVTRKRGKVTKGKIGIDLERKLVIHEEADPSIWRVEIDPRDLEEARKFASPDRQLLKEDLRKTLDSMISSAKTQSLRTSRRPSLTEPLPPSAEYNKTVRFSLPPNNRQSEQSVVGVSIQPSGTYRLGSAPARNSPARSTSHSSLLQQTPENIGIRVDPRYETAPVRQSLTQAFRTKEADRGGIREVTYAQVSEKRIVSAHGIRGLN